MSSVITGDRRQLALEFEPGLAARFRNAREVVAQGVYRRGLKTTAADLNKAPGNLSVELSDDGVRHFSLDSFEEYLQVTGDMQPLYYLVERYLGGEGAAPGQRHRVAPAVGGRRPADLSAGDRGVKRGDRVRVKGDACDGLQGVVVKPFGSATLVRFAAPVQRRNGMLSEEVWLATRQLTVVEPVNEAVSAT